MEKQLRKSKPRVDLTGKTFGYLTPMYYIKGGKWHCKCKCGKEVDVDTRNLNRGHTKSCGCLQKEKASNNTYNMLGYETESLKVLSRAGSDSQGLALWVCLCKNCGNTFVTRGSSIRGGYVNSCGCVRSKNEQNIIKLLNENNIEFSTQYTFSDLKGANDGLLRFDFAIFKNHKLSHLIEYNGEQHYIQPKGSWENGYDSLIENDRRKKEYCEKNHIRLIVIPYNKQYTIRDLL